MAKANATAKRGPIDYIRKRPDSKLLWFRYQFPKAMGWTTYEKPLGVPDMKTARERAAPHLIKCVAWVEEFKSRGDAAAERRQVATLDYLYEVGNHPLPDGGHVQADEDMCYFVAKDGRITGSKPRLVRRPVKGVFWTREEYQGAVNDGILGDGELLEWDCPGWRGEEIELPPGVTEPQQCRAPLDGGLIPDKAAPRSKPRPGPDDEHLERWIKHRNITGHTEDEAREVWALFRELIEGKPLKDCDRDDGRKLKDYYFGLGKRRATVQKKIFPLCAMVNLAIKEGKLRFNPFSDIVPKEKEGDVVKREDFSEEDMALVRENRAKFKDQEWLLWVLLATTGMRLSEAIKIEGEKRERSIRYIQIKRGKTKQSQRDVPLPDAFLKLHPQPIVGRLFPDWRPAPLSKRMNRRIDDVGITDPLKVIHSLRHRAKSKLRMEEDCKEAIEYALLGHEKITTAARYGKRPPMPVLKRWIEKIGY